MITANQNPEQLARNLIDKMLLASGWVVQSKKQINLAAGVGVAVREYHTNIGPADYILCVNRKAKRADKNFNECIFKKQAGTLKYTEEQVQWLRDDKGLLCQLVSCRQRRFRTQTF